MRKFCSNIYFGYFSFLEIPRDVVSEQHWEHPVPAVSENVSHDFSSNFWTDLFWLLSVKYLSYSQSK